mmetsp:Transcript_49760/g.144393  ORF Transcript_49760/g.144393 Transcript_49760/m.144393 type:complete len:360 (-) Transcript_49760:159-1238(-)
MSPDWTFRASTASSSRCSSEPPSPSSICTRSLAPTDFTRLPNALMISCWFTSRSTPSASKRAWMTVLSDCGPEPVSPRWLTSATAAATAGGTTCAPFNSTAVGRLAPTTSMTSSLSHSLQSSGAFSAISTSPSRPSQRPADLSCKAWPGNFRNPSMAAVHVRTSSTGGPSRSRSSEQRQTGTTRGFIAQGPASSAPPSSESVAIKPSSCSSKLSALTPPDVALEASRKSGSGPAGNPSSSGSSGSRAAVLSNAESAAVCSAVSSTQSSSQSLSSAERTESGPLPLATAAPARATASATPSGTACSRARLKGPRRRRCLPRGWSCAACTSSTWVPLLSLVILTFSVVESKTSPSSSNTTT